MEHQYSDYLLRSLLALCWLISGQSNNCQEYYDKLWVNKLRYHGDYEACHTLFTYGITFPFTFKSCTCSWICIKYAWLLLANQYIHTLEHVCESSNLELEYEIEIIAMKIYTLNQRILIFCECLHTTYKMHVIPILYCSANSAQTTVVAFW